MQRFNAIRSKRQQHTGGGTSIWRPLFTTGGPAAAYTSLLFLLILLTAIFVSSFWSTLSTTNSNSKATIAIATAISNQTLVEAVSATIEHNKSVEKQRRPRKSFQATLNCTRTGNQTCSANNYPTTRLKAEEMEENPKVCPEYFRWIHEDLRAWKKGNKGITREMVETAKKTAHFRLVVKDGRVYVERYKKSIQTRDVFTIWGIVQLLRRYPGGMVPDLELMFDCDDRPVILSRNYGDGSSNVTGPPPLFRYCGDRWTEDIVFPDWSFWGWAEIDIRPWEHLLEDIKIGNNKMKWEDREPYAYWKGNPFVDETRQHLLTCNTTSDSQDWNARLFVQDWIQESKQGFNQSNLANQCTYRYKIYIEGYAWSVSEKYILACDSVTLIVKPRFYDFFIRSLQPTHHYWPIRSDYGKCKSIKHAVDWGNTHKQKAQEIGKAASKFIQQELKMEYVYDYMFHLLNEYAKLLKFEPVVPEGAVEMCAESMACSRSGTTEKEFMRESMVKEPSTKAPCSLSPPFEPTSLRLFNANKNNFIRRVERWEDKYQPNIHT